MPENILAEGRADAGGCECSFDKHFKAKEKAVNQADTCDVGEGVNRKHRRRLISTNPQS